MPRGVKSGSKRGCYRRFNKPRLRKLAWDIRAGKIDPQAVAQAFDSTGRLPDRLIADRLRAGGQFDPQRLAQAVENLADRQNPVRVPKKLPLWMAKGALRHLALEYGGNGEPIHKALKAVYPYGEHHKVRAYYRQLEGDYGRRSTSTIERRLDDIWPHRKPGQHPELQQAIRESLSGPSVPLAIWRSISRKKIVKKGNF